MAAIPPPSGIATSSFTPDEQLLARFDGAGPRYTSYPTADRYTEAYDASHHLSVLGNRTLAGLQRPLSLYVHIPFCKSDCYYCACNKVITSDVSPAERYLNALRTETGMVRDALSAVTPVTQLHLGGGTPTFINDAQLRDLISMLESHFPFAPGAERSIEIDPRTVDAARLEALRQMGFTRISFGVQDFDPDVQTAVHRIQPEAQVYALMQAARDLAFESINIDLIYGLPRQTPQSFNRTLESVVRLIPDRVAVYGYAHLPERFASQRQIFPAELPDARARLGMLHAAIKILTAQGWDYIGMDHFARASDTLAVAKRIGRLHRNFQGYTTHPDCDLIALGASAISQIGAHYAQNARTLDEYYDHIERGRLATFRGHTMNADDLLRYTVIMGLMCQGEISFDATGEDHLIDFRRYFRQELTQLEAFASQGLIHLDHHGLQLTDKGWFFVRAVARVFDRYTRQAQTLSQYSRIL